MEVKKRGRPRKLKPNTIIEKKERKRGRPKNKTNKKNSYNERILEYKYKKEGYEVIEYDIEVDEDKKTYLKEEEDIGEEEYKRLQERSDFNKQNGHITEIVGYIIPNTSQYNRGIYLVRLYKQELTCLYPYEVDEEVFESELRSVGDCIKVNVKRGEERIHMKIVGYNMISEEYVIYYRYHAPEKKKNKKGSQTKTYAEWKHELFFTCVSKEEVEEKYEKLKNKYESVELRENEGLQYDVRYEYDIMEYKRIKKGTKEWLM